MSPSKHYILGLSSSLSLRIDERRREKAGPCKVCQVDERSHTNNYVLLTIFVKLDGVPKCDCLRGQASAWYHSIRGLDAKNNEWSKRNSTFFSSVAREVPRRFFFPHFAVLGPELASPPSQIPFREFTRCNHCVPECNITILLWLAGRQPLHPPIFAFLQRARGPETASQC